MTGQTKGESPLASFQKLSPSTYIKERSTSTDDGQDYPKTIVLAFWMNAPPRALAKYVEEYARLAPAARIIFVRSFPKDFLPRGWTQAEQARFAPAVQAIRASDSPVFLHAFSNGGASTTANLLRAYRELTGEPLRISSMIMDSAPGTTGIAAGVRALSFALPKMWLLRILGTMVLYGVVTAILFIQKVMRSEDGVSFGRRGVNDKDFMLSAADGKLMRCYIYSEEDELVDWKDIEKHALESEEEGWVVQREKFQGSRHVGHMRADPDRYWSIVRKSLGITSHGGQAKL